MREVHALVRDRIAVEPGEAAFGEIEAGYHHTTHQGGLVVPRPGALPVPGRHEGLRREGGADQRRRSHRTFTSRHLLRWQLTPVHASVIASAEDSIDSIGSVTLCDWSSM